MERRGRNRVDLKLECRVARGANTPRHSLSETENISRSGMLIRWPQSGHSVLPPRVGDAIHIEVQLPANPLFGQRYLCFEGTVVRISKDAESAPLIAVRTRKAKYRSAARKPPIFEQPSGSALVN